METVMIKDKKYLFKMCLLLTAKTNAKSKEMKRIWLKKIIELTKKQLKTIH